MATNETMKTPEPPVSRCYAAIALPVTAWPAKVVSSTPRCHQSSHWWALFHPSTFWFYIDIDRWYIYILCIYSVYIYILIYHRSIYRHIQYIYIYIHILYILYNYIYLPAKLQNYCAISCGAPPFFVSPRVGWQVRSFPGEYMSNHLDLLVNQLL